MLRKKLLNQKVLCSLYPTKVSVPFTLLLECSLQNVPFTLPNVPFTFKNFQMLPNHFINNFIGFFPQLLFPPTMIPSSSSTSSASSSSAFVSSSTPQNRLFPISSSTSGTNRSEFVASPITGQQQQYLNGDGNGGGLFGSNTILPPPPHQFSSLQQLQQQNLLFQRQQQQMQQSQQQHRHSPRLHHPFQHQPNPPQIDNHQQQLWFNLLSAIALGHTNGLPTASTSDLSQQQQQTIGGTDIRSLAAEKSGFLYSFLFL
ncbi:unnamed protein product [Meloidogyne enterolobii]|uniref:Uncharacterized protein n=1 Tax=Meloidogyne enterolobii TaxID=390850 RepID=A0ACB0Z6U3_MELEN